MKEIEYAQRMWLEAKAEAARRQEGYGDFGLAAKLNACQMFKGDESVEDLAALMFTQQGIEFMTRLSGGFPDLAVFRKFRRFSPERLGIYIDAGQVALKDEKRAFLVGKTTARMTYTATQGNRLVMMHGAKATVEASGWAVVKVDTDGTCRLEVRKSDHAKVLAR